MFLNDVASYHTIIEYSDSSAFNDIEYVFNS